MSENTAPPKLELFYLVLLKAGPKKDDIPQDKLMEIQHEHLGHIQHLAKQGKLIIAGPFMDAPDELRGLFVLQADSLEEAQALTDADPAVQAGRLSMQVIQWGVQEGALDPLIEQVRRMADDS